MSVVTLKTISLETATVIAQKALQSARTRKFLPLAVTVLDIRGEVKVHLAEDGTSLYRFKIATGKARGALGLGFGNRELQRRAEKAPFFIHAVQHLSEGDMVPVQGGVLIRDAQGTLLGAVGISGETSPNDEICAVDGIVAAGLIPDHGDPNA
ncbi:MAG: heme-binding protein [Betaproteobacteria bacterium]|jgi:uncharacterized protein GlcG (DUF336 family)|nr:heme-binding protein [Betaproteobacteria bacterium]